MIAKAVVDLISPLSDLFKNLQRVRAMDTARSSLYVD